MLDQQGLRRPAEPPAARRARARGSSCPRTTRTTAGSTPRCRSTARMHSLFGVSKAAADLLVQEYGRYFEHADRLLPRRLPDRPQPRRRAAARLPLLPDALHGHRRAVHGLRLRRQAGARQHPQRRRRRAPSTPSTRAPRAAAVYNLGGGRDSNCSMLEAIALCERDRRPRARLDARRRGRASATTAGGSATSATFRRDYPDWALDATTSRRSCARSTSRTSSAGRAPRMKLSVVIPAHNEAGSIAATVDGLVAALEREGIDYEILVVDDCEHRRHRGESSQQLGAGEPARPLHPLAPTATASASRCGPASSASRATRWRS